MQMQVVCKYIQNSLWIQEGPGKGCSGNSPFENAHNFFFPDNMSFFLEEYYTFPHLE